MHPAPLLPSADQTGILQYLHVMRQGGLGDVELVENTTGAEILSLGYKFRIRKRFSSPRALNSSAVFSVSMIPNLRKLMLIYIFNQDVTAVKRRNAPPSDSGFRLQELLDLRLREHLALRDDLAVHEKRRRSMMPASAIATGR